MAFAARLLPLLLLAVSVTGKAETIVLRAQSAVPGAYFDLGEIAAVEGIDALGSHASHSLLPQLRAPCWPTRCSTCQSSKQA